MVYNSFRLFINFVCLYYSQDICDMSIEIQSYQSDVNIFTAQLSTNTLSSLATPHVTPIVLLDAIISSKHKHLPQMVTSKESIIYLVRAVMIRIESFNNTKCVIPIDRINNVIAQFNNGVTLDNNIATFFNIIIILLTRRKELKETNDTKDDDNNEILPYDYLVEKLFQQITLFIDQWSKLIQTDPLVLTRLLEMIHTCLSSSSLDQTLPSIVLFLTDYLQTLISYSTEGYLSNNPTGFFLKLLEFISSLAEQDIEPAIAIQQNLPNLFGPFFGVQHHHVSCMLLEYGYLSVCSQHKKALLTDGINKTVSLWRLFPTLDRKMADKRALYVHSTSLEICEDILTELISFLPLSDSPPIPIMSDNSGNQLVEKEMDVVRAEELFEINEEERQRDNDGRILVLLRLLELACAMVSVLAIAYLTIFNHLCIYIIDQTW